MTDTPNTDTPEHEGPVADLDGFLESLDPLDLEDLIQKAWALVAQAWTLGAQGQEIPEDLLAAATDALDVLFYVSVVQAGGSTDVADEMLRRPHDSSVRMDPETNELFFEITFADDQEPAVWPPRAPEVL